MNRYAVFCIFWGWLLLASYSSSAQYVQRSSLGMAGSTAAFSYDGKPYFVSQSIAQSIIGTFTPASYTVRQGYQQPPGQIVVKPVSNELAVAVYPNPVAAYINISLREDVQADILVTLYDITGTIVYQENQSDLQNRQIDVKMLNPGVYLLRLTMGRKSYVAKIIKQ